MSGPMVNGRALKQLSSRENPFYQGLRNLAEQRKYRRQMGQTLIDRAAWGKIAGNSHMQMALQVLGEHTASSCCSAAVHHRRSRCAACRSPRCSRTGARYRLVLMRRRCLSRSRSKATN